MTTKQKVTARLAELGATIDNPRKDPWTRRWEVTVDAPEGHVWSSHGTHAIVITEADDMRTLWQWVWSEIGDEYPIPCEARPNCDVCDAEEE